MNKYIDSPFETDKNLLRFVTKDRQEVALSGEGKILSSYLKHKGIVQDIIDSFDHFVEYGINSVIKATPLIFHVIDRNGRKVPFRKYDIKITNVSLPIIGDQGEELTPEQAHLDELTMNLELFYSIQEMEVINGRWRETEASQVFNLERRPFSLGKIPTMVRSKYCNTGGKTNRELYEMGECPSWPGGYFITNGDMKTIIIKQKLRNNQFMIYKDEKSDAIAKCTMICSIPSGTTKVSVFRTALNDPVCIWLKFMGYQESGGKPKEINMFFTLELLRKYALNGENSLDQITSDILMFTDTSVHNKVEAIIEYTRILYLSYGNTFDSRMEVFSNLADIRGLSGQSLEQTLINNVKSSLFPQYDFDKSVLQKYIGTMTITSQKYYCLCYMISKYMEYLVGFRKEDDRNSVSNNKFDTPGLALTALFNDVWKNQITEYINTIESSGRLNELTIDSVNSFISTVATVIENTFETSIRSDDRWGYKSNRRTTNRTHMVDRLLLNTITLLYSEITKIVVPSAKQGAQLEVRENHQSQTGYIDFIDSPESAACGLTKRKAITSYISQERSDRNILRILYDNSLVLPFNQDEPNLFSLFVNGKLLGLCRSNVRDILRRYRISGHIPFDTMIVRDPYKKIIQINTDGGRFTRPLLIVNESGIPVMFEKNLFGQPFSVLLREGAAEYVDAYEQEFLLVSESLDELIRNRGIEGYPKYTHCELDPNSLFSFASAEIPLANHNLGTKNCYACNMMKQGIGTTGSNYFSRFDTGVKMLDNPTEPLMQSQMNIMSGLNQLPFGRNLMVLYMAYNGWNQEDAIIINKGSIERGIFDYTVYYKYKFISTTNQTASKLIDDEVNDPKYKNIDPETGIIREGSRVNVNDPLIRVRQTVVREGIKETVNADVVVKHGEMGIVTKVSAVGKVVKIKIENKRNFYTFQEEVGINYDFIGDKFSSRAATKGVLAKIIPEDEMPVSTTGLIPDLVINPLGIPTRSPINLLKEMQICLGHALKGKKVNGTTFNPVNDLENKSSEYLREYGYDQYGEHIMLNQKTGERFEGTFFMGLCYYMMLNHHSADKFQGQGKYIKRDVSTGQPVKGRRRRGGVRFGEMERDALQSHSISGIMFDTMTRSSDEYKCIMCTTCGGKTALDPTDIEENKRCAQCGLNTVFPTTIGRNYSYYTDLLTGMNVRLTHTLE